MRTKRCKVRISSTFCYRTVKNFRNCFVIDLLENTFLTYYSSAESNAQQAPGHYSCLLSHGMAAWRRAWRSHGATIHIGIMGLPPLKGGEDYMRYIVEYYRLWTSLTSKILNLGVQKRYAYQNDCLANVGRMRHDLGHLERPGLSLYIPLLIIMEGLLAPLKSRCSLHDRALTGVS